MSGGQRRSVILGTGSELPSKIVTNQDLEKIVETSDEWITVRTGIKERRILEEGKGNADMAFHAATRALQDAGMDPQDMDAIIMGTVTPDYPFPSSACVLEDMLGARGVFSLIEFSPAVSAFDFADRGPAVSIQLLRQFLAFQSQFGQILRVNRASLRQRCMQIFALRHRPLFASRLRA